MILPRRHRTARALCAVVALGMPAVVGACGSGGGGNGDSGFHSTGHTMSQTIPAQIERRPHGFATSDLLYPVNAWRVSSHSRLTEVDAGALAHDQTVGALMIFRHEFVSAGQHSNLVKVIGSGPLRITHAPQGRGVEASAQRNAEIHFVGARGVRGTLHLKDDSISLLPARSG